MTAVRPASHPNGTASRTMVRRTGAPPGSRTVIFFAATLFATTLLSLASPGQAQTPRGTGPDADILCQGAAADAVEPLPELVRDWVVILCTPTGQALAPQVSDTVILWLQHGTARPVLIEAVPRAFVARNPDYPVARMRFVAFAAHPVGGEARTSLLGFWQHLYRSDAPPEGLGDIVQLDALSVYNRTLFTLYFYLRDGAPRWLVVCREQCREALALDVLQGAELDARVAGQDKAGNPSGPR